MPHFLYLILVYWLRVLYGVSGRSTNPSGMTYPNLQYTPKALLLQNRFLSMVLDVFIPLRGKDQFSSPVIRKNIQ